MSTRLRNIGPSSWEMLERAGFGDVAAVQKAGAVAVYLAVIDAGGKPSLNLLYALYAGLEDRDWRDVSEEEKGRLLREVEDLRENLSPPAG